jgi:Rrf2 family protein
MAANSQFSMAVHVLTMLAKSGEDKVKSDFLACSVNTNPVVIRRLLGQLGHANLVMSQTGASGGTRLSRDPDEISLYDVYRSVACGEIFALPARSPSQDCPVGRNIEAVLCRLQKEIDRGIREKLSQYTLADVIEWIGPERRIEQGQVFEQGKV